MKNKNELKFKMIIIILITIFLISLLAPYIAPNDPYTVDLSKTLMKPSKEFLFGTDSLGRCVFSRVLGIYDVYFCTAPLYTLHNFHHLIL